MPGPFWFRVASRLLPREDRSEMRGDFLEWYVGRRRHQPRWRADAWLLGHTMQTAMRLRFDPRMWTGLAGDVRTPLRQLRRAPGFAATVIVVLALGIGATTSVFSLINAAYFAPMAVTDPAGLVVVGERNGTRILSVSYPNFLDWQERVTAFASMGAYQSDAATLRLGNAATRLRSYRVSRDWMSTLGVAPAMGRPFTPQDHTPGAPLTVMVSHATWTTLFAADINAIGRSVIIDDLPHTVVGVMAPGFDFYRDGEAWIPLEPLAGSDLMNRGARAGTAVIARLDQQASIEAARRELAGIAAQLAGDFPDANANVTATVTDLREALAGPGGSSLWLLFAAVMGLLAVGCLNAANLLSARMASRRHEFALRTALGASAARVSRQVLIEGLILSLCAGIAGSFVAWGMVTMAVRLGPPGIPGLADAGIDTRVLLFALGLSTCVGLVFGLAPLVQARAMGLRSPLADWGRTITGSRRWRRVRSALVVGQVALSLTLLSGSTLMARTLMELLNTDIGFETAPVLAASIQLNTSGTPEEGRERVRQFYSELISRLEHRPGVVSAAVANPVPLVGGGRQNSYWIEGQPYTGPSDLIRGIDTAMVSARYFETLGIRLIRGRTFGAGDIGPVAVAIVDETFAQRYWPDEDAIGKRLGGAPGSTNPQATVIGVVSAVRQADVAEPPRPQVYRHQAQMPFGGTLLVRAAGDPAALIETVRAEAAGLDPSAPVWSVRPLSDLVASSLALSRFSTAVLSAFALVGLTLAALGIYGLVAYDVAQRRREIGVYLALGATGAFVRHAVLRRAMTLVALGALLGLAGSVALAQALHATFANLTAGDPVAYVVATGVVLLAGLAGSLAPSLRAGRVNPTEALR